MGKPKIPPAQVKKAYVETRQGQVHLRFTEGGVGTPLVFLHRIPSTSASFEGMLGLLGGKYRLTAPDLPGFGGSFVPKSPFSVDQHAEVLLEALAARGIQHFHLLGVQAGAGVAVGMAASRPDRVKSLMLAAPVWRVGQTVPEAYLKLTDSVPILADGGHLVRLWSRCLDADPGGDPHTTHKVTLDSAGGCERIGQVREALLAHDTERVFTGLRCPVLLLCGTLDPLFPFFEALCARFPVLRYSAMTHCGAYAAELCAEHIVVEIQDFLSSLACGAAHACPSEKVKFG